MAGTNTVYPYHGHPERADARPAFAVRAMARWPGSGRSAALSPHRVDPGGAAPPRRSPSRAVGAGRCAGGPDRHPGGRHGLQPVGHRIIVYLAATAAGLMAVAGAAARAARPVPSAFYVARLIEKRRPDLKNSLITFVELASEGAADRSLCAAVGRRAARLLAGTDPVEFLPAPALRRPLAAAGAAALVLGACLWLAQGTLFAPWAAAAQAGPVGEAPTSLPLRKTRWPPGLWRDALRRGRKVMWRDALRRVRDAAATTERGPPSGEGSGRLAAGGSGTGHGGAPQAGSAGPMSPGLSNLHDAIGSPEQRTAGQGRPWHPSEMELASGGSATTERRGHDGAWPSRRGRNGARHRAGRQWPCRRPWRRGPGPVRSAAALHRSVAAGGAAAGHGLPARSP